MRTKVLLTVAVVAMLALGISAIASNMGFKISIPLVGGMTHQQWISIPYYNSYSSASLVFNELNVGGLAEVGHWLPNSFMMESYTSDLDPDFTITPGEGFYVKVPSAANWIVVGSHNPTQAVALTGGSTKQTWVSIPYHSDKTSASELWNSIPNLLEIGSWDPTAFMGTAYTSDLDPDITFTPGTAYYFKISGGNQNWTPSHY